MSKFNWQSSKPFCNVNSAMDRSKNACFAHPRARKFSCVTHISHILAMRFSSNRPPLKRSTSLPDCKELLKINSAAQITKNRQNDPKELKRHKSVNFQPEIVLISAAASNDIDTLRHLVTVKKANVNHKSPSGLTALHHASAEGNKESIKALIEFGAQVNTLDSQGFSPLDFAVRGGYFDCAALLIKGGAEIKRIVHGVTI